MARITDFLIAVSEDPKRLKEFRKNPDKELDTTSLTQEQRALIKRGNLDELRAAVKQEAGPGAVVLLWEAI
jgi:hypothetical protein